MNSIEYNAYGELMRINLVNKYNTSSTRLWMNCLKIMKNNGKLQFYRTY